ncbi:hypothetical protein HN51_004285 [Arachis hypogaea]|uniref:Uncharacterized protein n=1 Tax=Arachis hypogaea TaxID=3818 RepID=A0A444WPV4_ARAHY|nr:uncharacterized protein DS421_4g114170 [Arachis hypogaea]RYQ79388.1 hypothetical protein Ahy_Scaffold6g108126 [Arachis hypogaea]
MGSAYSSHHTNLGKDSTSFDADATGTVARWGDAAFTLSMGNWKENNDHTEVWGVEYKTNHHQNKKKHVCGFQLKANYDSNGVESIHFGIRDSSSENETKFALKITRVARDGLSGGITGIDSSSTGGGAPVSFTRAKESCTIETTIVSYGCSKRNGLFVLETKKKVSSENGYAVTLAHYYITTHFGLSVTAKVYRNKNGNGFHVEVEGPTKHPSDELSKVLAKTCRTGIWSPNLCSHCSSNNENNKINNVIGSKKTAIATIKNNGVSKSSSLLKATTPQSNHQEQQGKDEVIGQVVKQAMFSSNVEVQYNKGLINSTGNTTGFLNNSIIFMNYKLPNLG